VRRGATSRPSLSRIRDTRREYQEGKDAQLRSFWKSEVMSLPTEAGEGAANPNRTDSAHPSNRRMCIILSPFSVDGRCHHPAEPASPVLYNACCCCPPLRRDAKVDGHRPKIGHEEEDMPLLPRDECSGEAEGVGRKREGVGTRGKKVLLPL
jgi:hypothetical protein